MTRITGWGNAVGVPVTIGTGQLLVLGLRLFQGLFHFSMTAGAPRIGCLLSIRDDRGFMGGMAVSAAFGRHFLAMGFMALQTLGNVPVGRVTFVAEKVGMEARRLPHLLAHISMTGKTRVLYVAGERQRKGCVGIGVAVPTLRELIMGAISMAVRALRDDVGLYGWVALVTIETGDLRLVLCPLLIDRLDDLGMAFYAIRRREPFLGRGRAQEKQKEKGDRQRYRLPHFLPSLQVLHSSISRLFPSLSITSNGRCLCVEDDPAAPGIHHIDLPLPFVDEHVRGIR